MVWGAGARGHSAAPVSEVEGKSVLRALLSWAVQTYWLGKGTCIRPWQVDRFPAAEAGMRPLARPATGCASFQQVFTHVKQLFQKANNPGVEVSRF